MSELRRRLDVTTGLVCLVLAQHAFSDLTAAVLVVLAGCFMVPAVWGQLRETFRD